MKHFVLVFLGTIAFSAFSQSPEASVVAFVSNETRIDIVRASIPLSDWHEKSFWEQYGRYQGKMQAVSSLTHQALQRLVKADTTVDAGAYQDGCELFTCLSNELAVRREYFIQISREHNGIIGLQFLQTEAMLDMVESARIYDESPRQNFLFLPKAFPVANLKRAKYNAITNSLLLSEKEAALFFSVYSRYEQDCEDILGEGYDLYELFTIDATDFTPALSKTQGYNLLALMDREIKLKEKYFTEMNDVAGPSLSARFLAWEDYYSITCKMYIWTGQR